ncbi:MAG: zf-TFIIB domain-containing protein [Actinobacteria bacterium]|nr:zf-TFIIB domain-containing protein [Actinomycetota bacterium]
MAISCPKCQADMRTYERNGIHVDQCTECRGVYLDRGELEHLITAEAQWSAQQTQPPARSEPSQPSYSQPSYQQGSYAKPYKKRKNFLEELFD